jgi:hypothetical protein
MESKTVFPVITTSTGTLIPLQNLPSDTDAQATNSSGLLGTVARIYAYNGATFDRIRTAPLNTDAQLATGIGNVATASRLFAYNGATFDRLRSASTLTDAQAGDIGSLVNAGRVYGYNGATWDRMRVANVFKSAVITAAGSIALWTPTAGKKFRLMGYTLSVAGTLAAGAIEVIQLLDAAAVIARHGAFVPAAVASDTQIGADWGQGYLSTTINNVLNVNLGTAFTAGAVYVTAWGTEE